MKIKSMLALVVAMCALATASIAGPFETANAYLGGKYGVPDFTFNKTEFGNTALGQTIHLGAELVVEKVKGATVVYNPATASVDVYVDKYVNGGSGFNGKTIYANSKCKLLSGKTALGNPGPDGICLPADTLVGNAGGLSYLGNFYDSTIPGTARTCSFDAGKDGIDKHSC